MRNLRRRTLLAGVPAAGIVLSTVPRESTQAWAADNAAGIQTAQETAYAAFRIVREEPGEPSVPKISLPDGYAVVAGEAYAVASGAEFYTFVQGGYTGDGIEVRVRWPGTAVRAVVWHEERLRLTPDADDPDAFTFIVPVTYPSVSSTQATIQVWSHLPTPPGIDWRIEHNDPGRAAGPWLEVDWPAGQVRSVVHYLVAAERILIDSGVAAVAAEKGHFYALMGFETNNTLHTDNPPHWHLAYYAGEDFSARAYLPHFWFDEEGRNFYNGQDVTGQGRTPYRVGDPAPMYDFDGNPGNLVLTQTIREDGGLDIDTPDGPRYSLVPGSDGTFVHDLVVERDGAAWLGVATTDNVRAGWMRFAVHDLTTADRPERVEYRYDPLTGILREPAEREPADRQPGEREPADRQPTKR